MSTKALAVHILTHAVGMLVDYQAVRNAGGTVKPNDTVYGCHALVDAVKVLARADGHTFEGILGRKWNNESDLYITPEWAKPYYDAFTMAKEVYHDDAVVLFGDLHQGNSEKGYPWFWDYGYTETDHIPGLLDAAIACRKAAMQSAIRTLKGQQ